MTKHYTTNDFINQFGLEKAKEVLKGAPEGATTMSIATKHYFRKFNNPIYGEGKDSWMRIRITAEGLIEHSTRFAPILMPLDLKELQTAVEAHELVNSLGGLKGVDRILDDYHYSSFDLDDEEIAYVSKLEAAIKVVQG